MMTSKAKGQLDGGLLKIMSSFLQMTQKKKRAESLSTYKNEIKIINNLQFFGTSSYKCKDGHQDIRRHFLLP